MFDATRTIRACQCSLMPFIVRQVGVYVSDRVLGPVRSVRVQGGGDRTGFPEYLHREGWLHRVRCLQLGSCYRPTQHAHSHDDPIF